MQQNGSGNRIEDANTSQLEPMEMVSECNPITNVVKTTIHTMATTLNCSSDRFGAGSGKHISIRVRAQLLQPPEFAYIFTLCYINLICLLKSIDGLQEILGGQTPPQT